MAEISGADHERLKALFGTDRDEFHKEVKHLLGERMTTGDPLPEDLKLFQSANSFFQSALAIKKETKVESTLMFAFAPYSVCIAFSCELLMKCLLSIEKSPALKTHNLRKLFGTLTPVSQESITNSYVEQIKESNVDMRQHLKSIANAFEDVRYMHEHDQLTIYINRLYALTVAVAERIRDTAPSWLNRDTSTPEATQAELDDAKELSSESKQTPIFGGRALGWSVLLGLAVIVFVLLS